MQILLILLHCVTCVTDTSFVKTDDCTLMQAIIKDQHVNSEDSFYISKYSRSIIFGKSSRKYILEDLKPFLDRKEFKELKNLVKKEIDTTLTTWGNNCFPDIYFLNSELEVKNEILKNKNLMAVGNNEAIRNIYKLSKPEYFYGNKCVLIQVSNFVTNGLYNVCYYLYKKEDNGLWKFATKFNCY